MASHFAKTFDFDEKSDALWKRDFVSFSDEIALKVQNTSEKAFL